MPEFHIHIFKRLRVPKKVICVWLFSSKRFSRFVRSKPILFSMWSNDSSYMVSSTENNSMPMYAIFWNLKTNNLTFRLGRAPKTCCKELALDLVYFVCHIVLDNRSHCHPSIHHCVYHLVKSQNRMKTNPLETS